MTNFVTLRLVTLTEHFCFPIVRFVNSSVVLIAQMFK